jgi:3-isopropylmalate/(R)-2-methylmalate dehydratase large subunit
MTHPRGKTISEKILSRHSGTDARAGDVVVCDVQMALATDGSAPMTIDYFEAMGGTRVFDGDRVLMSRDHYAPPATVGAVRLHDRMVRFGRSQGVDVLEVGQGISFQVAAEQGRILPGTVVVGADSHTVTGGALNAFATGVGSSDLAAALICGSLWLRVPETIRVSLLGRLHRSALAKDLALALVGRLGSEGANYRAIEFSGPGVGSLDVGDRMVVSNMLVESGAKVSIFPFDEATERYLEGRTETPFEGTLPDADAGCSEEIVLDLAGIGPGVALPHRPENVVPVTQVAGTPVDMVFVGTCTGGRAEDFRAALEWIRHAGGQVNPGVQLVLTPASREVLLELEEDGTLAALVRLGGTLTTPGCGPCCGTSGPIPGDGLTVLSTANRNFRARMGNDKALIYLASPAVCGVAAALGHIADPRGVADLWR